MEPDVGVSRFVAVHADSRRQIHGRELPSRDRAVAVARQIHGELELVPRADDGTNRAVAEPRDLAVHPADGDRGDRKAAAEYAHSDAVPAPQPLLEAPGCS